MQIDPTNAADVASAVKSVTQKLLAEFPEGDVKLKPAMVKGTRCLALAYIDARLVMDRLDEVLHIDGWRDEYTVLPTGEVECRLSLRIAGQWVTKADVGGQSEQPDEGDRMKAAYSDALKRAAVKFGVGRYLYRRPQQWLDYDPVKKQIVRPQAANKSGRPADRQAENPKLRAEIAAAVDAAGCRADLVAPWRQYEAAIAAGTLGPEDDQFLKARFQIAGQKFPAPAKK